MQMKRRQRYKRQQRTGEEGRKNKDYWIFWFIFGNEEDSRDKVIKNKEKADSIVQEEKQSLSTGLVKKMESAQQNAKPKNLHCENESHYEKKSDLESRHLLRSKKRNHHRGKTRRTVKSRGSSKLMDKSRKAKLHMENKDDIGCERSANNGKSVSSRKRNHRDKSKHHESKDVILLLEAARDEIFRIKEKTLSNLARAAAKIQKAIKGLQHMVREHINSKQVKTRQLREASKEINLVRFLFDFRAFDVPGEHEEDENKEEAKNDKKHQEKSFSIPTTHTQDSMKRRRKDQGNRSKLKMTFTKSKARAKVTTVLNSCIHGETTTGSFVMQKPNGVQGRLTQGKEINNEMKHSMGNRNTNNGKEIDPIWLRESKDIILYLEAARDKIYRMKERTLSKLGRVAAKAQKAIEGLKHVVREHINAKQVSTRQLRSASNEINLVRFVFDFRAFEVPGEHEEDKNNGEPKNDKKQEENSLSIPPFSITHVPIIALGKGQGDHSKLKAENDRTKVKARVPELLDFSDSGEGTKKDPFIQNTNAVKEVQKHRSPYSNDTKPVNEMVSENRKVQNKRFSLGKAKERVTSVPAYRPMPLPLLVLENLEVVRPIVPRKNESSTRSTPSVRKEKFKSEIYEINTNRENNGTVGSFQKENELVLGSSVKTVEDSNGSTSATVLIENIKYMSVGCAIWSIRLEANEDAYANLNQQKLIWETCPSDVRQDPLAPFEPKAQVCPLYGSMDGERSASLNITTKEPPRTQQLKFPLVVRTSANTQGNESCLAVDVSPGYLAPKEEENISSDVCQARISNISNEVAFLPASRGFLLQVGPLAISTTNIEVEGLEPVQISTETEMGTNVSVNNDKCFYEDVQENARKEEEEKKITVDSFSSNISTTAENINNTEIPVTKTPQKPSADTVSSDLRRNEKASHVLSTNPVKLEAHDDDYCIAGSSNVSIITNKGDYVDKTADPMVTFENTKVPGTTVTKRSEKNDKYRTITMKDDISNVIIPNQLKLVAEHSTLLSVIRADEVLKALQAVSRGEKVHPFWKEMIVKTYKLLAAENEKQRGKRPYAAPGPKGSQAKMEYTVDFQKKGVIEKSPKPGEEIIDRSMSKGIGPSLLGRTVFESGNGFLSIEAKPNQTMCEPKRKTALMSIGERMYNSFEDLMSQIFRPPVEVNEFGQQRIDALLKNGKKARVFRNKVISEAQIMQMKRRQRYERQQKAGEEGRKNKDYWIFWFIFGNEEDSRDKVIKNEEKADSIVQEVKQSLSTELVKKVESAQQNSKPKNLHHKNENHSEKKSDLESGHMLRSKKKNHHRGKTRRTAKSRGSSKLMDKSRKAKLDMKNKDDISCENSANNGKAKEDGKSVSSRKRNHRDKIRHHESKDVIFLLEAARDEIFRMKEKTLSNLARAAAKAQKAIEGLQHVVREHINSKQVKTRQLREASKEINLVRFVFDFRAYEVPGEYEEDENKGEAKNDKKHQEKSFSIPTTHTQASMKRIGKDQGGCSKLKMTFKKTKARTKVTTVLNSCIHSEKTTGSLVTQKPNGVEGRQNQGKEASNKMKHSMGNRNTNNGKEIDPIWLRESKDIILYLEAARDEIYRMKERTLSNLGLVAAKAQKAIEGLKHVVREHINAEQISTRQLRRASKEINLVRFVFDFRSFEVPGEHEKEKTHGEAKNDKKQEEDSLSIPPFSITHVPITAMGKGQVDHSKLKAENDITKVRDRLPELLAYSDSGERTKKELFAQNTNAVKEIQNPGSPCANDAKPVKEMVSEKIKVQSKRLSLSKAKERLTSVPAYRSIPLPLLVLENLAVVRPIVPRKNECSEKSTPSLSNENIRTAIYEINTNRKNDGTIGSFQKENELVLGSSVKTVEDSNGSITAIVLMENVKRMSVGCAVCSVRLEADEDVYANLNQQKLTWEACPSDVKQDPLAPFEPKSQVCPPFATMDAEKSLSLNIITNEPPRTQQLKFPLVLRTSANTQGNESCLAVDVSPGYLAPKEEENISSDVCQARISNISNEVAFLPTSRGFSLEVEPLAISTTNIVVGGCEPVQISTETEMGANVSVNNDKCFYEDVQENARKEKAEERKITVDSFSSNISTTAENINNTEIPVTKKPQKSSADTVSSDLRRNEKASHVVSTNAIKLEAHDDDYCVAGSSNVSIITNKGDYINKTADQMVTFENTKVPGTTVSKRSEKNDKYRTITMKDDISNVIIPKQLKLVAEHSSFASNDRNNKMEDGKTVLSVIRADEVLKALQAVSRGEKVHPFWKEMIVKTYKLLAAENEKQRGKRPYAAPGPKGSQAKMEYTVDFQKKGVIEKSQKPGEEIIDRSMSKGKAFETVSVRSLSHGCCHKAVVTRLLSQGDDHMTFS
eukprot:gene16805-8268_t